MIVVCPSGLKIRGMVFRMVSRNASNQESLQAVSNNQGSK